jgi:hypothetical protein
MNHEKNQTGRLPLYYVKSSIFWDITPGSLLKVNGPFTGTCHPHLQGRRIIQAKRQRESRWQAKLSVKCSVNVLLAKNADIYTYTTNPIPVFHVV